MGTQKSQRRCCTESEQFTTIFVVWKLRESPTYFRKKIFFYRTNFPHFFISIWSKQEFLVLGNSGHTRTKTDEAHTCGLGRKKNLRAEKKSHFREAKSTTSTHEGFPKVEWRISRREKRWMCALLAKEEAGEGIFPNAKSKERKKGQQQRHRTQDY